MVGRMEGNRLTVFGVGTAEEWEEVLERARLQSKTPVRLSLRPDGFGPSDHSSFYSRGIPVLHFFTNTHPDYHRPSDDWEHINDVGLERVVDVVTAVAIELTGAVEHAALALTPIETGASHDSSTPKTSPARRPLPGTGRTSARSRTWREMT